MCVGDGAEHGVEIPPLALDLLLPPVAIDYHVPPAHFEDHNLPPFTEEPDSSDEEEFLQLHHDVEMDDEQPPDEDGDEQDPAFDYDAGNQPAGPSSSLTRGQLLSILMAMYFRFGWTKVCLDKVLRVINLLVPNSVPKNIYYLSKHFFKAKSKVVVHFKCPRCHGYLGAAVRVINCQTCSIEYKTDSLFALNSYFLASSIEDQLRDMLEQTNVWNNIMENKKKSTDRNFLSDVYTGKSYHKVALQEFLSSGDNISISFSTDGVRVSKSSAWEIWPLFVTINEMTYTLKSKFLMLSSLWFGNRKPSPETFFTPFIDEISNLFLNGFTWKRDDITRTTRVAVLFGIFDAPVRSLLTNFKQFNGKFGCGYCLHQGVRLEKGNGYMRAFPPVNPAPEPRNHKTTLKHATQAVNENVTDVFGVKGPSVLFLLQDFGFDIIHGIVPDYMHCVLLGITDQFLSTWLTSVGEEFYIKKASLLDEVLLRIKPPNEVRRTPRSIEKFLALWKASEFRNWLLFYSAIALKSVLPTSYYNHWLLLVNSIHLLLHKKITQDSVRICKVLVQKFIEGVSDLYGDSQCTYNVHTLEHVVEFVEKWGGMWAWSSFLTEDAGGRLKNQFHGTTYIGNQIFENFLASKTYREYARPHICLADDEVTEFFEGIDAPLSSDQLYLNDAFSPLGKKDVVKLSASERIAIGYKCMEWNCKYGYSYERFGINGKLLSTAAYCNGYKRDNSIVSLLTGNGDAVFVEISGIFLVSKHCNCVSEGQGCGLESASDDELQPIVVGRKLASEPVTPVVEHETGVNLTRFINRLDLQTMFARSVAFDPTQIVNKCICITGHDGHVYCIENKVRFEKD